MQHLKKYYNNSLENIGRGDSFIWYGPRWAQAATAPSRLYKAFTTEGGVRVPFVAQFPKSIPLPKTSQGLLSAVTGGKETGSIIDAFSTVMDLAPTILAMAGVSHPAPTYQGREVVPMRGSSMLPFLTGTSSNDNAAIHPSDHITGWETCGRAAVRCGDWKIVFIPAPKGPEKWQLYNLKRDPGEVYDLSGKDPERMQKMLKMWDQYVLETGVVPLAPALGEWLAAAEAQMPEDAWMEYRYWEEGAREDPPAHTKDIPRFKRRVDGQATIAA